MESARRPSVPKDLTAEAQMRMRRGEGDCGRALLEGNLGFDHVDGIQDALIANVAARDQTYATADRGDRVRHV